jgi:hypothetical protein
VRLQSTQRQNGPAKVSDKLATRNFGTGTRGFSALEDHNVAVCVLPGTELSFADEVKITRRNPWPDVIKHKTAIFRQINQDDPEGPSRCAGIPERRGCAADILGARPRSKYSQI